MTIRPPPAHSSAIASEASLEQCAKGSRRKITHFTRLAKGIDIQPFLGEVDAVPDMWFADTSRQRKVRCQRNTLNIFLRAPRKPLPPGAKKANDVHESRRTRAAAKFPHTLAFCKNIANQWGAVLGRATLVSLQPKSRAFPHIDTGAYYRIRDRLNLVLKSTEGSPLTAEKEAVVMREGELWIFNNKVRHSAVNSSNEPRIYLIFDLLAASVRSFYALPPENVGKANAIGTAAPARSIDSRPGRLSS